MHNGLSTNADRLLTIVQATYVEAYLSIYCTSYPEDWPKALHLMEFTHNNRRHADRMKTPFELMFGESPITLPLSFENTKYPAVEDRMKTLIKN